MGSLRDVALWSGIDDGAGSLFVLGSPLCHTDSFLDGFLPIRTKVRHALVTDSEVRNIFATSGESTTILLPSAYRLAYVPRKSLLKAYSASMSACLSRPAFIGYANTHTPLALIS